MQTIQFGKYHRNIKVDLKFEVTEYKPKVFKKVNIINYHYSDCGSLSFITICILRLCIQCKQTASVEYSFWWGGIIDYSRSQIQNI